MHGNFEYYADSEVCGNLLSPDCYFFRHTNCSFTDAQAAYVHFYGKSSSMDYHPEKQVLLFQMLWHIQNIDEEPVVFTHLNPITIVATNPPQRWCSCLWELTNLALWEHVMRKEWGFDSLYDWKLGVDEVSYPFSQHLMRQRYCPSWYCSHPQTVGEGGVAFSVSAIRKVVGRQVPCDSCAPWWQGVEYRCKYHWLGQNWKNAGGIWAVHGNSQRGGINSQHTKDIFGHWRWVFVLAVDCCHWEPHRCRPTSQAQLHPVRIFLHEYASGTWPNQRDAPFKLAGTQERHFPQSVIRTAGLPTQFFSPYDCRCWREVTTL